MNDTPTTNEAEDDLLSREEAETAMAWLQGIGTGAAQGATTGMAGGPWGALIGGLAGAGLGALQTAQRQQQPRSAGPANASRRTKTIPPNIPAGAAARAPRPPATPAAPAPPAPPAASVSAEPTPGPGLPPPPAPAAPVLSGPDNGGTAALPTSGAPLAMATGTATAPPLQIATLLGDLDRLLPSLLRLAHVIGGAAAAARPVGPDTPPASPGPAAPVSESPDSEVAGGLFYSDHLHHQHPHPPETEAEHHGAGVSAGVSSPLLVANATAPDLDTLPDGEDLADWREDFLLLDHESHWA